MTNYLSDGDAISSGIRSENLPTLYEVLSVMPKGTYIKIALYNGYKNAFKFCFQISDFPTIIDFTKENGLFNSILEELFMFSKLYYRVCAINYDKAGYIKLNVEYHYQEPNPLELVNEFTPSIDISFDDFNNVIQRLRDPRDANNKIDLWFIDRHPDKPIPNTNSKIIISKSRIPTDQINEMGNQHPFLMALKESLHEYCIYKISNFHKRIVLLVDKKEK